MSGKRWTENEIEILKSNYDKLDKNILLKLLPNRDYNSIQQKASKLKLCNKKIWTNVDVDLLKESINNKLLLEEIYDIFNGKFSIHGIKDKIYSLGLSLKYNDNNWSDLEINILKNNFNRCTNKELLELLPNKTLTSIKDKATYLKLKRNKETLKRIRHEGQQKREDIWKKEENDLIRQHYSSSGTSILKDLLSNRSTDCIRVQARKLGLTFEKENWTKEMDEYVKKNYKNFNDIYELTYNFNNYFGLNKTYCSLNSRLGRLNLKMTPTVKIAKKNEDKIIKLINDGYTDEEVAKLFKCTTSRIAILRQQNGILLSEKWSKDEVNLLYKMFPTESIRDICEAIPNRSWKMIKWKASNLNIKRLVSNFTNKLEDKDLDAVWIRAKREEHSYQGDSWEDYDRMTYEEIEYMYEFFNKKCPYCGEKYRDISFDHFIPMVKGGKLTKDNTIICCLTCNSSKQGNDFKEWYLNKDFEHIKDKHDQINKIYTYFKIIKEGE